MYSESAPAPVEDPYSDNYTAPAPAAATPAPEPAAPRDRDPPPSRGRSRSRSPGRAGSYRSPPPSFGRRRSPPPTRPKQAPANPTPTNVLGVFGLSIRSTERDLEDEFNRFGRVEKVTIVYDQRSDRSRGFGFIRMATVEDATRCVQELNGIDLNGRRIRVDYSVTDRPHAPTPGEYMGHRRSAARGEFRREPYRDSYRDRDRDRKDHDRDNRDRERDPYGRDNRDWRDRRSPPPRRYSPDRRRRSYSRSPPRGSGSSPSRARDYEAPAASDSRW